MVKLFRLRRTYRNIEAGDYQIVRLFDSTRVLVDISMPYTYRSLSPGRQLTLLPISKGTLL